ncbi:carboxylesterase [Megavirus chiliensis]|uniref:Carboxylesterase n=2 Tax=Megamimivirinae TaxID=3044648 RepID=G5CSV8_9VIRU|nr:putative cholinesterase [Megavirus chiliensis]AEQ33177.1 carboxylesterase [Megavirus chiliensis]AVG47818.1 putative cholinesterase [Acanthamoeba polyphaga mimivirus]
MTNHNIIILLLLGICCIQATQFTQVNIDNGPIKGVLQYVEGRAIRVFKGIPFAEPPVNNLRWKAPVPYTKKWHKPLNTTEYKPRCPQYVATGTIPDPRGISEDCLYTNVWAPVPEYHGETFPVMVWIHGGAFISGSPEDFGAGNFSILAVTKRIIIVAASYRVNAFGFFSSALLGKSQPEARGVYGLLDQRLGLKWVKNNIAAFGGKSKDITIYGQSAGGISVCLQAVTPLNDLPGEKLFNRVIGSSGYCDILPMTNNSADAGLVQKLNCTTKECLYALPWQNITNAVGPGFLSFQPTVGINHFLPDQPISLLAERTNPRNKNFVPDIYMQGFAANEGTFVLYNYFPQTYDNPNTPGFPTQQIADALSIASGNYSAEFYYNNLAPLYSTEYNPNVTYPGQGFISRVDDIMACNTRRNMIYWQRSKKTKAHSWYFDSAPDTRVYPSWTKVFHESDVFYVARHCDGLWCTNLTCQQDNLGKTMDIYWNSAIRSGSLTPKNQFDNLRDVPVWPQYGKNEVVMHFTAAGENKGPQTSILFSSIISADGDYQYLQRCETLDKVRAEYYNIPALDPNTYFNTCST